MAVPQAVTQGRSTGRRGDVRADKPLVAIIEDDEDIALSIEELLNDEGQRTVWYANGAEALNELDAGAETPSIFLLDLMMPQMDGWTFRLRQRERPALRDVPVVVMSADRSSQAAAIDADAFLAKPVHADRLLQALREAQLESDRRKLMATSLELERLRSLGMLVGTIAHELNNPLQCVSGHLDLLVRDCARLGDVADPLSGSLAAMRVGTDSITNIVRELRTFARAESSEGVADLTRALDAAIRLGEHVMRGKGVVERRYDAGLPHVVGNEGRLAQVFLNLLVNAAQAMDAAAQATNVVTVTVREAEGRVVVEVRDTGCGISEQALLRVFEPFFTTKAPGEGTGIGLSFSRTVLESFGGSISAHSKVGEGSTFRVELVPADGAHKPD